MGYLDLFKIRKVKIIFDNLFWELNSFFILNPAIIIIHKSH